MYIRDDPFAHRLPVLGFDDSEMALQQMLAITRDLRQVYQERNDALNKLAKAHHEALLRLTLAAEYRDDDTGVHIVRLGYMAERLAQRLGEPERYCHMLRLAAPMHDIGKVGIPDAVLKKPGALTPEERLVMNEHPTMGARILGNSEVPLFKLAAEVALTHHEKFDGSGYPNGLAGKDIPLSGRIVALVDFFDALTMDRCYRKAIPDDTALEMVAMQRGHHFDPDLVEVFLGATDEFITLLDEINAKPITFETMMADLPLE